MKRFISLVLVLLMITTMLPLGMMAIAETAPTWVIEDFVNVSDCSVTGLSGQTTETVNGFSTVIGTSTGAGFSKSITPAISITDYEKDYLALKLKFYIEDPTVMNTVGAPQIELTSSGKCDVNELHWSFSTLSLKAGWNDLLLNFSDGVATGGMLDITNINYIRIYTFFTAETKAGFGPMEIVTTHGGADFDGSFAIVKDGMSTPPQSVEAWVHPNNYGANEWMISDFDGTDEIPVTDSCGGNTKTYTTDGGASVLSCDVPAGEWISLRHESMPSTAGIALPSGYGMKDLALSVRVYIEDVTAILEANVEIANTRCDTDEISWDLNALNAVKPLQNGWNELVLPFNSYSKMSGEFTVSKIKWWRFNFDNTADGASVYKLDYIKIVPLRADNSLMIVDFNGNESLAIADSCGSNTKVYTTEDNASILHCTTAGGEWISLKQEGLPNTAGIILPEDKTMEELALSVRVYIEDVSAIVAANVEIANTNMDTDEISWDLDALNAVQPLKNGWNELVLPFNSHSKMNGEFTVSQIKWWRFNFDNTEDGTNIYKMDYIKIVPMEVEMSTMINDFDNTSSIEITDSCSNNTKTYETIDGATVLTCDVPAAQWISLRQETLPETSGIALPSGYGMNELALAVRVYIEDVTAILAANVEIANTHCDTDEISWDLDALNAAQPLKNGWNELVLPFNSHSKMDGEFTVSQIKWWRFNFDNTNDGTSVYMLDYLKIVPLVQKEEPSTDTPDQERNYLFSYTDTSEKSQGLFVDNEGLLYWLDGDKTVNTGAYLAPNEWSHVAYTLDPATKTLIVYMNGQATSNFTLTADLPTEGMFRIGAGPDGFDGGVFSGKIGDVRVWNDIRTETEIVDNYQILINTATEGLYANWRLNEDMGFVAAVPQDKVGANHASILWRNWSGDWIPYEEPENYDYTFVAVPDPQILAASYPDVYQKLFQYIADNAESQNIEYVLGLGDLTDGNGLAEWETVREAFDRIEGKVPYANVLGNHDYGNWNQPYRDTTRYNDYFKYADHSARSDWGGAYEEGKMDNVYYCFDVGNTPYMVICLEFLPRDGAIAWANQVVAAHPDRNVIVLTHGYINGSTGEVNSEPQSDYGFIINNPDPYNGGKKIWEKFISQHKNIVMSLCGHTFCKDDNVIMRADAGVNGNTVIQLCLNAQTIDESYFEKTGVGMLGLLRFSENGQKVALQYYSPHTEMCFREVNQFSFALQEVTAQQKAADQAAAQVVVDQIDQLNVQSLDDKAGVVAARAAYDALTDAQKEYVTNLDKLSDAERAIAEMEASQADKDAAKAVEDQIEAMDATDPQAVADARTAYNNLTDLQKFLVPNLQKLLDAEEALKSADIPYGDVNGDNTVDAKDALMILQAAVDKAELTHEQTVKADVNGDKAIDAKDALLVLQKAVDKIEKFPVEK